MFDWLFSLFKRKDRYDVFTPGEKKIFTYFDGQKEVKADPIRLYKKYAQVGPELYVDDTVANSIMKEAPQAHTRVIEKIRDIFDIKPFEQGGLLEADTYNLMIKFINYCEIVKKNSRTSQTTSPTLGVYPPISATKDHPTSNTSDFGSTEKEKNTEKLESSPLEPQLPKDQ